MVTKKQISPFKKDSFETLFWQKNELVCGIDEVGRGCLAGPVVVAAVILPIHSSYRNLKDSKQMTHEERVRSHRWITKNCLYSWTAVDHRMIDAVNIYQATLVAMRRAVMQLLVKCPKKPSMILVDAMPLSLAGTAYEHIDVTYFNYAESKSRSIAAASIVAKVERDALMQRYCTLIPGYSLSEHKGYATERHRDAIYAKGISILHRKSFLSNIQTPTERYETQQTLC